MTQWIRQPLRDINKINERLDIVEALVLDTDIRQQLFDQHLRTIPDLQALMRKIQRKKANLQDCYRYEIYFLINYMNIYYTYLNS